jgi:hypothetical protein
VASTEDKFAEGVQPFLEDGEQVLVTCVAQARGHTRHVISGLKLGGQQFKNMQAANEAEVRVENPMALVLTNKHVLTVKIGTPLGLGVGGKVKEVMTAIPLEEVESITANRFALRQNISLVIHGTEIKLETNAKAKAGPLAEKFAELKP